MLISIYLQIIVQHGQSNFLFNIFTKYFIIFDCLLCLIIIKLWLMFANNWWWRDLGFFTVGPTFASGRIRPPGAQPIVFRVGGSGLERILPCSRGAAHLVLRKLHLRAARPGGTRRAFRIHRYRFFHSAVCLRCLSSVRLWFSQHSASDCGSSFQDHFRNPCLEDFVVLYFFHLFFCS